jgi:hypothetical protein
MTATHASKALLDTIKDDLREIYFPPANRVEKFEMGKPVKSRNEPSAIGGVAVSFFFGSVGFCLTSSCSGSSLDSRMYHSRFWLAVHGRTRWKFLV